METMNLLGHDYCLQLDILPWLPEAWLFPAVALADVAVCVTAGFWALVWFKSRSFGFSVPSACFSRA